MAIAGFTVGGFWYGILAVIAGIIILIWPAIIAYVIGIYLVIVGVLSIVASL
jgi:uncharacterized membrane protein HdeD (DUF308 family)